jgi:hypothetical protein
MTRRRPTRENHERLRTDAWVRFAALIGLLPASRSASVTAASRVGNAPRSTTVGPVVSHTVHASAPVRSTLNRSHGVA